MMDIVVESVKKIEVLVEQGGCTDAGVLLDVDPDATICQFEQGASMSAKFGGRNAVFSTYDPIRAQTKIAFMFGAPLDTAPVRGAATAIINVVLGFLCMTRVLNPCPVTSHQSCREQLECEVTGKRAYCIGTMGKTGSKTFNYLVDTPSDADIILINGEGLIAVETGDIIDAYRNSKRILCIGPSSAGIARLYEIEHWCPYGRSCQN